MNILEIFWPIQWLLGWITFIFHSALLAVGMPDGPGFAWPLSIILMTLFIKICLIPLILRQIRINRKMQALAPKIKAIQKKYKNKTGSDAKSAMGQETMALYRENKANPMSSCLPMLFQGPILFSLYGLLSALGRISTGESTPIGPIDQVVAAEMQDSYFFFSKLSYTFSTDLLNSKITIVCVIIFMSVSMFLSQTFNLRFNTPLVTQNDQAHKMQKWMAYIFPVMYIFTGLNVPVGVLVYWVISNFWMLGQTLFQIFVIPTPGSKAADAKDKRTEAKNLARGILPPEPEIISAPQRYQPVSKKRAKKRN